MKHGGITFSGRSGEKYYFEVWPLETRFRTVAAVYFVTKRSFENNTYRRACHDAIYIGQTENLSDAFVNPLQLDSFRKYGANCVCVYPVANEERRMAVEQDLLAAHSTHCNK